MRNSRDAVLAGYFRISFAGKKILNELVLANSSIDAQISGVIPRLEWPAITAF